MKRFPFNNWAASADQAVHNRDDASGRLHTTGELTHRPFVARQPLLLQFWVVPTLTLLMAVGGLAFWWQQQLPARVRRAAANENWSECLQASEQLQALRWPGTKASAEQTLCRRLQAEALWMKGERLAALRLQQQLIISAGSTAEDTAQLQAWRQSLREQALIKYQQGDLAEALMLLSSVEQSDQDKTLSAVLEDNWHRNRLEAERAGDLVGDQRWWEALDRLNRVDHPWWQQQTQEQRQTVNAAITALSSSEEHLQHGTSQSDVIQGESLNMAVQEKLEQGVEAWTAFEAGCRSLGGKVEEDGPESFCRADPTAKP